MRKKTVTIRWSYPIQFYRRYDKDIIYRTGVYCIYRKFGNKIKLLYIGKTIHSFESRMNCHELWLCYLRGELYIRFGEIVYPLYYNNDLIEDIESALIYELQPEYNDKKKRCYTYRSGYYVFINNIGFRGYIPKVINAKEQADL